jgi:Holliday junction resolvasome RuvABC endonuclease subunit
MNILALDCSTKSTGVAVYEDTNLIFHCCITSSSTDLFKRIHKMVDEINLLVQKYNISKLVLEEVRPDDIGARSNLNTHRALMWLQGAIAMMIHDEHPKTTIDYLYPSEWRKLCGIKTGRGIVRETVKQSDIKFVKDTFNLTVNDDEADAIAIGYAFLHPAPKEEISAW